MTDRELASIACFRLRETSHRLVRLAESALDPRLVELLRAAAKSLHEKERLLGRHGLGRAVTLPDAKFQGGQGSAS